MTNKQILRSLISEYNRVAKCKRATPKLINEVMTLARNQLIFLNKKAAENGFVLVGMDNLEEFKRWEFVSHLSLLKFIGAKVREIYSKCDVYDQLVIKFLTLKPWQ